MDDTPRRRFIPRFKVSREPEVDKRKRTDIEVSCAAGKVCIEIKPLDSTRRYSARGLFEDTLKKQLVGQYLKGHNSNSGILVLVYLEDKGWKIPNKTNRGSFQDLVTYLRVQATEITIQNSEVDRIEITGMNCLLE